LKQLEVGLLILLVVAVGIVEVAITAIKWACSLTCPVSGLEWAKCKRRRF
jgi:hypothetical protein